LRQIKPDPYAGIELGFVYHYMSNIHALLRDPEKVMATFTKAIDAYRSRVENDPLNPYAWDQLALGRDIMGYTLLILGRQQEADLCFLEAAAAFEEEFRVAPREPRTLNQVARFLVTCSDPRLRDPARAIELCRQAIARKPERSYLIWS